MGDGVLAYFGYPEAHEDAAERAINAGLGIVASVAAGRGNSDKVDRASVRVGIATGFVVVGDMIGREGSQVTVLTLNRLGRRASALLAAAVSGGLALPDAVLQQIVVKTDGVPLFVEEFNG
jgi:class 3 adenylate cyclase